jgi:hypothetical protein
MPDLLQDTLEVQVQGDTYIFTIPSLLDEIKLGLREREIRRSLEREMFGPSYVATGEPTGDRSTDFIVRVAAYFETLLKQASATWPYSKGQNGEPVIDFRQWPKNKSETAMAVGVNFEAQLRSFRERGAADSNGTGGETVAGQPDTQNQSV